MTRKRNPVIDLTKGGLALGIGSGIAGGIGGTAGDNLGKAMSIASIGLPVSAFGTVIKQTKKLKVK
jgi:hypothetical protein